MAHRRHVKGQPRHYRGSSAPLPSGIEISFATPESRRRPEPARTNAQRTVSPTPMRLSWGRTLRMAFGY